MAIVFHSEKYNDIKVDSHKLIGVMGDYHEFFKSLERSNICYLDNKLINSRKSVYVAIDGANIKESILNKAINDLELDDSFLDKKLCNLSHSENKLFKYLQMITTNSNIIVIDEPFQDLDYKKKKKMISIFNQLSKTKTIIIGSCSSDIIYSLCKKVLLLGKNYLYDDVSVLSNKSILKRFHILMPEIVEFVRIANDKKVKLPYVKDIRDLIKDVYKNVSK